ncbi:MAG: glycosyltransferase [Alphaproteobacteria bacterium CG11_big_fil_rev_8_21_14_0_20_44_7]|nr:MAG: glycosyltransferase [Alphaproteobacteria bacterium CG11_big_fil_rev_8_21_14_0_20_44_7]
MQALDKNGIDKKLGEILVEKGLIEQYQLDSALRLQKEENSLLGKILIGEDYINNKILHEAIAEKNGLEFVDLATRPPNPKLLETNARDDYFRLDVIPWRESTESIILATCSITDELRKWAISKYPYKQVDFVITSPFDIHWALQANFRKMDDEFARLSLWRRNPNLSARQLFSTFTANAGIIFLAILTGLFIAFPAQTFLTIFIGLNILFFSTITFKLISFVYGVERDFSEKEYNGSYPIYTVLVPLYMEKETLPKLIEAIKNLDYPKSKLDVKLVIESDDMMTLSAIKELKPPSYFEIIKVPYSLPRTKPKACNYALRFAKGEIITIFDAEDIPHPNQLKAVLTKFAENDESLVCVQARLNYYNYNDNQLTRWFALEYTTWFDIVMNGFEKLKLPIPLGGTSNHIKADILHKIGGWDAFNVTEDADLGMRIAQLGLHSATVNSITMEEAPNTINAWVKQRTRWIKGFMQTYIVHMRKPFSLLKKTGLRGFMAFQFFVGAPPLIYITSPILLLSSVILTFGETPVVQIPEWLFIFAIYNLIFGAASHIIFCMIASLKAQKDSQKLFPRPLIFSCLTFPLYSIFHIFASFRSLQQLIRNPHYWEKTQHGLTKKTLDSQAI